MKNGTKTGLMFYRVSLILTFTACCIFFSIVSSASAKIITCPPFYLRTDTGDIINPMTGENADQPYSSRQTCGACHDYDKITSGYHFQQGWDEISDTFNADKPWMLSPGMMGKM